MSKRINKLKKTPRSEYFKLFVDAGLSISKHVLIGLYDLCAGLLDVMADPYGTAKGRQPGYYSAYSKKQVRQAMYALKKQNLIKTRYQDGQTLFALTSRGLEQARKAIILNSLTKIKQRKWDGKWRLVIFDIPEENRHLRNWFRGLLKDMGFSMLQASVWAYPHDVFNQLEILIPDIKKHNWIKLLLVDVIVGEEDFRKLFGV